MNHVHPARHTLRAMLVLLEEQILKTKEYRLMKLEAQMSLQSLREEIIKIDKKIGTNGTTVTVKESAEAAKAVRRY